MCKPLIGYKSASMSTSSLKGQRHLAGRHETTTLLSRCIWDETSCSMGTLGNVLLGTGRRCGEELTRGLSEPSGYVCSFT